MRPDRVLLVDDEASFLEILAERMRSRGVDVTCATSGREAIERSRAANLLTGGLFTDPLFGRTREALTGTNYLDLIPPADRTEVVNGLQKLTPRHPTNNVTHRVVLPDGQIRWTRWRHSEPARNPLAAEALGVPTKSSAGVQPEALGLAVQYTVGGDACR